LGFEIEGVLTAKGGFEAEKKRLENLSEFQNIKRSLADNDARKKMRETYGFPSSNIGHTPNPILLYSEDELNDFKTKHREQYGAKISIIEEYLQEEKKKYPQEEDKFNKAIKNVALLSQEEIFFLDLFYKRKDDAKTNKIAIDDLFDWRDKDENHKEKFLGILQEIGEKGGFYQKTLDMIRVTEFAIGEFPLEDAKENFSKSLKDFRKVAGEHGLRLQDRGVQINIGAIYGKETLEISTENSGKDLRVSTNQLTVIVIKAIQNALTRLLEDDPSLQREGQDIFGVEVGVDRKKGLTSETKGTDFFISFDPENPEKSAFHTHRKNTGKSGMGRLARISGDDKASKPVMHSDGIERKVGVSAFEARLLGNNPHGPNKDGFAREIFNGAVVIAEKGIEYLQDAPFIEDIKEGFRNLLSAGINIDERVFIKKDGAIDSLPRVPLENKVERAPLPIATKHYVNKLVVNSIGGRD